MPFTAALIPLLLTAIASAITYGAVLAGLLLTAATAKTPARRHRTQNLLDALLPRPDGNPKADESAITW
jgi:hypothetical protein